MEQSLSTLTFKGSIIEAIAEAKQQKKLFVVYISGDNLESHNLATSTWADSTLAESILKYCILLHISAGSTDAANFSALYPQKSPPCLTAIGYNGVLLWQYDGFFTADIVASSIEKSWLSLHIQETTATYLTAALASKNQPTSETSGSSSSDQGSSSRENNMSSPVNVPEVESSARHEKGEETSFPESASKDENSKPHDMVLAESPLVNEMGTSEYYGTSGASATPGPVCFSNTQDKSVTPKEILSVDLSQSVKSNSTKVEKNEIEACKNDSGGTKDSNGLEPAATKSSDVHFNIKLPDGTSLRTKLSVMDPLRKVKDYVDENRTSYIGPYNLAIPYPRKVFGEQDLRMTLQELDLFGRQTLIVVPHGPRTSQVNIVPSVRGQTNFDGDASSNGSHTGYWAYVRRIVSFFNPFSYLGGGASSPDISQDHKSSMQSHGANPSSRNNLRAAGRSYGVNSSNQSTSVARRTSGRPQTRPPFGSNIHSIHTLKRDEEDDNRSSDRNTFWNGNSTQYGGDNNDSN
ncbi:OLC1v1018756C1 [Oldenlandia corymbosa var. corymbosa]|uniref:OLC1v1018756C1 n=1 Tax=Oldenlandia corymbosa var. corymbosa TaxID=529605 RepID=A0AAV1ECC1_OLDCO|nr:OLC1v1018756C1 [Oldenlandia corymbosa var. corymbosa]